MGVRLELLQEVDGFSLEVKGGISSQRRYALAI